MTLKLLHLLKSNQIKLIVLRGLGVGLLFLATLVMTNYYEQSIVGEFELTRSILVVLGSLVLAGTDRSVLQFAGQLSSADKMGQFLGIYKKIIFLFFLISFSLFLLYFLIPDYLLKTYSNNYLLLKIIASLFFYAVALFNTEVFRVFDKNSWSEAYRGFFKYIILFLGAVGFLFTEYSYLIIDLFLFSFVLLSIGSILHLRPLFKTGYCESDISYKNILKTSFPMALSSLGFFLLLSIDILFLKYYNGDDLVAIYAQPVKIITLIAMIQTTLQASISKKIASFYHSRDRDALISIISKYTRLIAILSLPFLILFLLLPKTILSFFGPEYTSGSNALLLLLIGTFVNAICGCTNVYMNMTGKQVAFRNIIFATIILNLTLNFILIPVYGIEGAAIASALSLIFWNLVTVTYVYFKEHIILILR
jgi:O-antigen/teichoic acid export membrane protein